MTLQADKTTDTDSEDLREIKELTSVVQNLISMMGAGNIGSLKLEYGSLRLSLQSNQRVSQQVEKVVVTDAAPEVPAEVPVPESPQGHIITAPMIGTFYVAPAPNEPPFVTVGQEIREGQTVGIVEAMKIMNEIAADRSGTVVEIIASDGQTVEYGSPLIRIEPSVE